MPKDALKDMLDAAVHFGHKTQKWNPKMRRYLYGSRSGIHIFDLEKTQACLEKALDFLQQSAASGKTILLVSTKPQAAQLIVDAAGATKMPYVVHKWMGGLFTNFSTVKQRIRYFRKLREEEKTGEFAKYTKKEASVLRKDITKLESALGGVRDLERTPDVVFVADAVRDRIVVREANKIHIPVVAICDSNADPDGVQYPIPGNDDAIKSLTYLINAVKDAIVAGKK
ncbi:MAG TPA: 30S ribosomal protein S2 [Candidatus Gracilibacteria bacterium]|nr:30S ribosomal protein S2 [Candidatus Gracilibacteria bacterium]